jgi:hypothetical protein
VLVDGGTGDAGFFGEDVHAEARGSPFPGETTGSLDDPRARRAYEFSTGGAHWWVPEFM